MSLPLFPSEQPQQPQTPPPASTGDGVEIGRMPPRQVQVRIPQVKPTVTYTLLVVTIAIFLLQMASQYLLGEDYLIAFGAKENSLIRQGQLWRFFTPVFLHVSLTHIAFNMYALFVIGRDLERYYGHQRFSVLYFLAGFAGNVASFWMSTKPSAGASTALFGLIAAQGVFIYQNRKIFGSQSARMLSNVILVVVINLALGLSPGIDNWGHLGGLVGGVIFAFLAGPKLAVGGLYPDLTLVDHTESSRVYSVAALEAAGIAVVAWLGMIR